MMDITEQVAHTAQRASDKIASAASQAGAAVEEKGHKIKAAGQRAEANGRSYVHDNPVTSLGMAVAVGFLFSRLLSLR
jgi:ElaB/YqjD/DUF883 family membrane-anchored ribosome-binding protein